MIKLIAISGKRESGKTTLANYLVKDFGYTKISLAAPLKRMCQDLYDLTDEELYGKEKEKPLKYKRTNGSPWTARDILIREGCLKRSIDPDFWCKQIKETIEGSSPTHKWNYFVIDDIRFLNEINYLKREFPNSHFVRLERSQEAIEKAALDDISETELDNYKGWDAKLEAEFNRVPNDLKKFAEYLVCHND